MFRDIEIPKNVPNENDFVPENVAESLDESGVDTGEKLDSTAGKIVEENLVEVETREEKLEQVSKSETAEKAEDKPTIYENLETAAKAGGAAGMQGFILAGNKSMDIGRGLGDDTKTNIGRLHLGISTLLGTVGVLWASKKIAKFEGTKDEKAKSKLGRIGKVLAYSICSLGPFAISRWMLKNYERIPEYASIQEKFMSLIGKNKKISGKNLRIKVKEATNSAGEEDPMIQLYSTYKFIGEVNKSLVEDSKKFDEWSTDAVEKWEKSKNVA